MNLTYTFEEKLSRIEDLLADIDLLENSNVNGGTLLQRVPLGDTETIVEIPAGLMAPVTEVILQHKRKLIVDILRMKSE